MSVNDDSHNEASDDHVGHYVRPVDEAEAPAPAVRPWTRRERITAFLQGLLGDRQGDTYTSLAPRRPDGTRTKLFFFNGNGQSR